MRAYVCASRSNLFIITWNIMERENNYKSMVAKNETEFRCAIFYFPFDKIYNIKKIIYLKAAYGLQNIIIFSDIAGLLSCIIIGVLRLDS